MFKAILLRTQSNKNGHNFVVCFEVYRQNSIFSLINIPKHLEVASTLRGTGIAVDVIKIPDQHGQHTSHFIMTTERFRPLECYVLSFAAIHDEMLMDGFDRGHDG